MSSYGANPVPLWHLIPLFAIALVMLVNIGTNRAFLIFQSRRDARRHRVAIAAELESLLALVRENLRLIRSDAGFVLSARSFTSVYRGSMGRLTFLREAEIAAVVATYTALERLEALTAARAKPAGPAVYRFEGAKPDLPLLRREFHKAAAEIEKTLRLLGGAAKADARAAEAPLPAPVLAAAAA